MDKHIKQFEEARNILLEAISKFPNEKRGEKLFGSWDLKDVVAHFTGWDNEFSTTLMAVSVGIKPTYWGKIYVFNEDVVNKSRNKSWGKVFKELEQSGLNFIGCYKNIPEDLLNKKIWNDKIYTPMRIIEINIHHYQKAQLVEINKLLEKWGI